MNKVKDYGQVFTPNSIVQEMLSLRGNFGTILEPSSGYGSFSHKIPNCIGIEIDPEVCPSDCLCMDFFDYSTMNKFDTIIGNPPYVACKNIIPQTKSKLKGFDNRTNLYVHFIDKCLDHLKPHGEIIFITPRDFMKSTSAAPLNEKLYSLGTITHLYDLGDKIIFNGYSPNCIIWRFEKDNFNRQIFHFVNGILSFKPKMFTCLNGMLLLTSKVYNVSFKDHFYVKVGAVSGLDKVFTSELGNKEFVCSTTRDDGKLRKMFWGKLPQLEQYKQDLLNRKIKKFDEHNWWEWGRKHHLSNAKRIYVNCKTRKKDPFFYHPCNDYDGSVLAIFPRENIDQNYLVQRFNSVDWEELGFICDGRYLFSQRSLESIHLPDNFW